MAYDRRMRGLFRCLERYAAGVISRCGMCSMSSEGSVVFCGSIYFRGSVGKCPLRVVSCTPGSGVVHGRGCVSRFVGGSESVFFILTLKSMEVFLANSIRSSALRGVPDGCFKGHMRVVGVPRRKSSDSIGVLSLK